MINLMLTWMLMKWLQVEMWMNDETDDSMKVKELFENHSGVTAPVREQELYDGGGGGS